jgi:hypothetical protein
MVWKGPLIDGVTQSLISRFLECPYAFYLYAIMGVQEDTPPPENMVWGDTFHKGLEILLDTKSRSAASEAMIDHLATKYPAAPASFKVTTTKMLDLYKIKNNHMDAEWQTELVLDLYYKIRGYNVRFRGKLDGLTYDHPDYPALMVEHKCKGYIDPLQVRDELHLDLQCNLYMFLHDVEFVAYDLIKIPEAQKYGPPPSYGETAADWADKLFHGPVGSYGGNYPIHKAPHKWVHQSVYTITEEQQQTYWNTTIIPLVLRMIEWYEYVTSSEFSIEDPASYGPIFYRHPIRHFSGRKTESFKCPYYSYLVGQSDITDLIPVSSYYSELENV